MSIASSVNSCKWQLDFHTKDFYYHLLPTSLASSQSSNSTIQVEGSWTEAKTALEHLKSREEEFTRWTENSPDLFSLEEASHMLIPTMVSLVLFTVSGHQFVLHCPTHQVSKA